MCHTPLHMSDGNSGEPNNLWRDGRREGRREGRNRLGEGGREGGKGECIGGERQERKEGEVAG